MGLRVGEAIALKINDIDFTNKKLNIDKTITLDENKHLKLSDTPKTINGKRVLPIPDYLVDILKEQVEYNSKFDNPENLLFLPNKATSDEKYIACTTINKFFKRLLSKLDIEVTGHSTHSLRHTYTTRLVESGAELEHIKELLGHSDERLTIKYYTTVFDRFKYLELTKLFNYYKEQQLLDYDFNLDLNILKDKIEEIDDQ